MPTDTQILDWLSALPHGFMWNGGNQIVIDGKPYDGANLREAAAAAMERLRGSSAG